MKLRLIVRNVWAIWGICNAQGDDPISRLALDDDEGDACLALLERVAEHGPRVLPDNRNHAISDDPKILQITPNPKCRVAYFFDAGKTLVICHAYQKAGGKRGKTAASDVAVARRAHDAYWEAKNSQEVEFDEE